MRSKMSRVDVADDGGRTALVRASAHGHVDVVRYLLEMNANTEAADQDQLHPAAMDGHINVVKLSLDQDAYIEATHNGQCTALHIAALAGHVNVVELLLDQGANIEDAEAGDLTIVCALLANKASVNTVDEDGDTPLICAAMEGHDSIVKVILKHGVIVNARNLQGKAALLNAVEQNREDIAQMIRSA